MIRYNNQSYQIFFLAISLKRQRSQLPIQNLLTKEVVFASVYVLEQQKEIYTSRQEIDFELSARDSIDISEEDVKLLHEYHRPEDMFGS
jgi:hypothetical protein